LFVLWDLGVLFVSGQKEVVMRASKLLALATLFLATTFARADWKEFASPEGNFKMVFPGTPQQQRGTDRNLHQFSASAGAESYGLTYADYSPGTDGESVVNHARDSIVNGFGGSVVDEKRAAIEDYPGKRIRFVGKNTIGELAIYFVGSRLYVLHSFAPKGTQQPQNFSRFLNSFRLLSKPKRSGSV
jgi:hypothetical protein